MILATLGTSLLGNILTGRGINRAGEGIIRAENGTATKKTQGKWTERAGQKGKIDF